MPTNFIVNAPTADGGEQRFTVTIDRDNCSLDYARKYLPKLKLRKLAGVNPAEIEVEGPFATRPDQESRMEVYKESGKRVDRTAIIPPNRSVLPARPAVTPPATT